MRKQISPKELATAIGVSESSLKRWADSGRLRVSRTLGGHRRINIQEAIRFSRTSNMPIKRPDVLGITPSASTQEIKENPQNAFRIILEKLRNDDAEEVRAIILEQYLVGQTLATICDDLIRPAMQEIGRAWQFTDRGIVIEHRATDLCISALNVLRHVIEDNEGQSDEATAKPRAIGGAPQNDPYLLPSLMACCVLLDQGFHATNLGPNTPVRTLELSVDAYQPKVVWLSLSVEPRDVKPQDVESLADKLQAIDSHLVLGGRGLTDRFKLQRSNLHWFASMAEFAAFAKGIVVQPAVIQ